MSALTPKENKGFTLLFAALVATLILSIGIAIADITLTQLILSSAGKESQFAFYNSDSGIECALNYEYNGQSRADGSAFFSSSGVFPEQPVVCNGKTASVSMVGSGSAATTTFIINPTASCSSPNELTYEVKVGRAARDTYSTAVYIESRGYNTCDGNNPRRVERGLYVSLID